MDSLASAMHIGIGLWLTFVIVCVVMLYAAIMGRLV